MNAIDLLELIGNTDETIIQEAKLPSQTISHEFKFILLDKKIAIACTFIILFFTASAAVYAVVPHLITDKIERHRIENDITSALYHYDEDNIKSIALFIGSEDDEVIVNILITCKTNEINESIQNEIKNYIANRLEMNVSNVYLKCLLAED